MPQQWTSGDSFEIGGIEYVCRQLKGRFLSVPRRFCLLKERWSVDWYEQLLEKCAPSAIVEIGMYDGASLALFADIAKPRKIVGIDLRSTSSVALDDFIAHRGLRGTVVPYYGVDQADAARLGGIIRDEFHDEPLDLVVDDASHLLDPTRRTFDALFPRLRPGGLYIIEDWPFTHLQHPDEVPLTVLVFELILTCAYRSLAISEMTVNRNYAVITRGDADIDPGSFHLSGCYGPRAKSLIANLR